MGYPWHGDFTSAVPVYVHHLTEPQLHDSSSSPKPPQGRSCFRNRRVRVSDGETAALTISDPPTQAEVEALRDKCEELADDVRALSTLVHALRTALVIEGLIQGDS
jgi:hypothetical protein